MGKTEKRLPKSKKTHRKDFDNLRFQYYDDKDVIHIHDDHHGEDKLRFVYDAQKFQILIEDILRTLHTHTSPFYIEGNPEEDDHLDEDLSPVCLQFVCTIEGWEVELTTKDSTNGNKINSELNDFLHDFINSY